MSCPECLGTGVSMKLDKYGNLCEVTCPLCKGTGEINLNNNGEGVDDDDGFV
jgi:DnaJ-class molecular chaperone